MTKKVAWPTWDKLQNSAIIVMVASVIFALVIIAMDKVIDVAMKMIYAL